MSAPSSFTTCDLCDAHEGDTSGAFRVLAPVFHDYGAVRAFAGPVHTVRAPEDNSRVREAVNSPGEGRVLVIDGGGSLESALVGDLIAASAVENGWAGIIVHGAIRDRAEIATLPLGVKALGSNPRKSAKDGVGVVDEVVTIDGVVFRPGARLFADEDGVLVEQ